MNKRKLTPEERRLKRERKAKFMTIFVGGKQKRVRRPPLIEGLPVDEFIARNADPLWLHQNEMWELIPLDRTDDGLQNWESEESNSHFQDQSEINASSELPTVETPTVETPTVKTSAENAQETPTENAHGQGFDEIPF